MIQTADTSPDNLLFTASRPCTSPIQRTAVATYQKFGKCIFAGVFTLFGCGFIRNFTFTGTPCKFLLNTVERVPINDWRMMVCHQIHGTFAIVFHNLFGNAVSSKCFLQKHIAHIFFIFQNAFDVGFAPDLIAHGSQFPFRFKSILYSCEAQSVQK